MRKRLKNLVLTEVSLVDKGANPGAAVLLLKAASVPPAVNREAGAVGHDVQLAKCLQGALPATADLLIKAHALAAGSVANGGGRLTFEQAAADLMDREPGLYDLAEEQRASFRDARGWSARGGGM